jgi:tRNA (cmo5U34)-methyltransferase
MKKDTIYQSTQSNIAPFEFNTEVVQVFEDMISRSVPGYRASIELAMILATEVCQAGDHVYDLGCSLGAATFALLNQKAMSKLKVTAVDMSEPMLQELWARVQPQALTQNSHKPVFPKKMTQLGTRGHTLFLLLEDITQMKFEPCKLVLLNYVLQFIPMEHRFDLLQRIFEALPTGGILLLSEKVTHQDKQQQEILNRLHLQFKRLQGYSEMEIHGKRTALERVLIPETIEAHQQRLFQIGFQQVSVAVSQLNFTSIIAIK